MQAVQGEPNAEEEALSTSLDVRRAANTGATSGTRSVTAGELFTFIAFTFGLLSALAPLPADQWWAQALSWIDVAMAYFILFRFLCGIYRGLQAFVSEVKFEVSLAARAAVRSGFSLGAPRRRRSDDQR